jgi:MFS family permease
VSARPTLPLYIGGFLGPFGGAVIAVLIPELRDSFGASTEMVAAALPAYLVPFALLQLVSGTIGERLGRRRVVRAGYLAYALFSILAALSPSIEAFLATRALQGAANAFLTPLVLAGLAEVVPAARLGRSVGTFSAVQTAAIALAPLCGGLLGAVDWRLVFIVPALVAVALAFLPPPDSVRAAGVGPARLRAAFTGRVGLMAGAAFMGFAGATGVAFMVSIFTEEAFGLGATARGVLLAGFGVSGMLLGHSSGRLVDRFGRVPVVTAGAVTTAALIATIGFADSAAAAAASWTLAGAGSALLWAGLNTLVIEAVPLNRAGATSVVLAAKFAGSAAAPVMWLPIYAVDPRLAFACAGAMVALVAAVVMPLRVVTARA